MIFIYSKYLDLNNYKTANISFTCNFLITLHFNSVPSSPIILSHFSAISGTRYIQIYLNPVVSQLLQKPTQIPIFNSTYPTYLLQSFPLI